MASSNWLALQKKLGPSTSTKKRKASTTSSSDPSPPNKRRKLVEDFTRGTAAAPIPSPAPSATDDATITTLRNIIDGNLPPTPSLKDPGKYISMDCEMVGIGLDGSESSLARVSVVNYHGYILMDEIVQQREKVVDFRTRWSGIREGDLKRAKPFEEIQKQVSTLLDDRILIGHAVHNDLKALLLTHPRQSTIDTQIYAYKHKVTKSKYISLKNLVMQELDVSIQEGEHSSVIDARATMSIFRLHKKEWEKGAEVRAARSERKRQRKVAEFPGGGRKGISSGLSTVVTKRKNGDGHSGGGEKGRGGSGGDWWTKL
ncbi:MipD protein [Flagelloscypha sp. PMI_526]|nr:MipD protein [Flagelloscypha sp. PMI_526]